MAEENAEALQWFRERLDHVAAVLEADAAEQTLFTAMREARARGLSQQAMRATLVQKGFTTRQDTVLSPMQVHRIMRRAAVA